MLIISCHSDTCFFSHALKKLPHGVMEGHLDNFSGVYSVMEAFFSGRMDHDHVHIEFTWGEETDMGGALALLKQLDPHDVVLVVDVTGTPTQKDFVIEKCKNAYFRDFLCDSLSGMSFDLYENCPDPVANEDEVDIYAPQCPYTCFIGIPCFDGDYNEGPVKCREGSLDALSEALCRISEYFPKFCQTVNIPVINP